MLPNRKVFHEIFEFGIGIKAINGILQVTFGLILFFISQETLSNGVQWIVKGELNEDPTGFIANHLLNASFHLSLSTQHFISIYLIIDGAIKLILFVGLWKEKTWAYPASGIFLSLLILYSSYRLIRHFSYILLFLVLVDLVILILLKSEYDLSKKHRKKNKNF